MTVSELATTIDALQPKKSLKIVGISGFCGSGKSTLAEELRRRIAGAEVVSIDDFIVGEKQQRSKDWHTFDRERLRREILEVAEPHKPLTYMQYQSGVYASGRPGTSRTIQPESCLIVEGCSVLHPSLVAYYDLSVWINCPVEVAIERAKERDKAEGNDDSRLWDETWRPNDTDYYVKYHPTSLASVIFDWTR